MSMHTRRDLACQARASYGEKGWTLAVRERDANPPAPREEDIPLVGEHFDPGYASRELFTHNWHVLGGKRPVGEWTQHEDGSWTAYVDDVPGCPRPGCEAKVYGCRWPHGAALPECESRPAAATRKAQ